jgi:methyl-accepting chemotaxis protein
VKLRTQITALGLAGAALAALVGGIGLYSASGLRDAIEMSIQSGAALQASQEADMMHDAIRGDGQLALFGALQKSPERIKEAEEGLVTHVETFQSALAKLDGLPISLESRAALTAVRPQVNAYFEAARQVVQAARVDDKSAQKMVPALQSAFTALEKTMAELSDTIETNGKLLDAGAKAAVGQARVSIGVALLLATASMVAGALWLAGHLTGPMGIAVGAAERLAQGDLGTPIVPTGNDETRQLLASMARMQASFSGIVREVKASADRVASGSVQIAQGNLDVSSRTEQQASALQQTAATMDELGSTVRNNAVSADQANTLALGASDIAVRGGAVVGQVVETMKGINDSSRKIADIIGVIDGIAFQTNILALNAAVEAARAGEQGRGFAVVAAEVRSLAQRSADAAREIKALITASVARVGQGTAQVDEAGRTMAEIVTAIRRVNDIVAEISAASHEQSAGVTQVGQTVSNMDRATQQNAALVEQGAAAADDLRQQAQDLVRAVAVFRLGPSAMAA